MKKQKLLILILLISSFMLTIGYSSFSKNLGIEDLTAVVREQSDIRITGISVNKVTNNAISTYEEYDRDNISIGIELPNDTSSITYNIEIFNYGSVLNILKRIEGLPSNLEYTISDYEEGTIICNIANICNLGIGRDIKLTIKYKDNTNTTTETQYFLNLSFIFQQAQTEFTFDYTGDYQTFTAPYDGNYKIELWGASGGTSNDNFSLGGPGAYTSGIISLKNNINLYLYIGGNGQYTTPGGTGVVNGGYNGGGASAGQPCCTGQPRSFGTGGGATDVRLVSGKWDEFDSLKSRIMVAAGGGGAFVESLSNSASGAAAGGLNGYKGIANYNSSIYCGGIGGTQISSSAIDNCQTQLLDHDYSSQGLPTGRFGFGGSYSIYGIDVQSANSAGGGSGYFGGSKSGHVASAGGVFYFWPSWFSSNFRKFNI